MTQDFHIKSHPLQPNHLFMDIHKQKAVKRLKEEDHFEKYKGYEEKIELLFSDLPKEHKFWLINGSVISSLKELYASLDSMDDKIFFHHVSEGKNDFSDWVRNIYHDEELAKKLDKSTTRRETRRVLEDHIDEMLKLEEKPQDDISFFKALIKKMSSQNKKLADELAEKKEWISKREKELEDWEEKNISHEKKLNDKYKELENQEKLLLEKFNELQSEQQDLKKQLTDEKKAIEDQDHKLRIEKERIVEQDHILREERKEIERQKEEMKEKEVHHEKITQKYMLTKHSSIYTRLDELMSYITSCVYNRNYKEARDAMSKVKYYYSILPINDPKKKEFYQKIIQMKRQVSESLKV